MEAQRRVSIGDMLAGNRSGVHWSHRSVSSQIPSGPTGESCRCIVAPRCMQCGATTCNVLQRPAMHCNDLQRPAMHCNEVQCIAEGVGAIRATCNETPVEPGQGSCNRGSLDKIGNC